MSRAVAGRSAVPAAAAIAWLGLVVHNVADLAGQTPWSQETLYPALVTLGLLAVWSRRRRVGSTLLLGWAALHLVGGGLLSVLPLPVWPFVPEQSLRHYAFHVLYALTQLPLLVVAATELRGAGLDSRRPQSASRSAESR